MPYKSEKQRRYLHKFKPKVAARFDAEEKKSAGSSTTKPRKKAKK